MPLPASKETLEKRAKQAAQARHSQASYPSGINPVPLPSLAELARASQPPTEQPSQNQDKTEIPESKVDAEEPGEVGATDVVAFPVQRVTGDICIDLDASEEEEAKKTSNTVPGQATSRSES